MKQVFTIITLLVIMAVSQLQNAQAQSPQKMSYQAVIRNSSDKLVTNKPVGMKISILQGSATGTVVYTETQTPSTNANGLVSIEFGGGTGFDQIDWSMGPFFIKTETDPTGSTNYTITGTSQLLSVPYAFYAANSGNGISNGIEAGNTPFWNGTKWVTNSSNLFNNGGNIGIGTSSPSYGLHLGQDKVFRLEGYTSTITANAFSMGGYGTFGIDKPGIANGRFIVTDAGNVGIGVTTPDAPLSFDGTGQKIHFYNSQTDGYSIGVETGNLVIAGGTGSTDGILFKTQGFNGTGRMRIWKDQISIVSDAHFGVDAPNVPFGKFVVNIDGNVGIGTANPQSKLDINSTTGGVIFPRMTTTQRDALTPVNGMIIYNTSTNQFNFYENSSWVTK